MREINKFSEISTKKGDKGTSKNYSNESFSKSDVLFEILGTIDELSSVLGVAYHTGLYQEEIKIIQLKLQHIGSLVATTNVVVRKEKLTQIEVKDVLYLEQIEQSILDHKPLEPKFVLPGSDTSKEGSYFDLARAVSRRTERRLVDFINVQDRDDLDLSLAYLNRLSDVLFVIARSLD